MRRSLLKRPSPGLVLAVVALFVALGGGAYAATSSDNKTDKKIAKSAAKSYFNANIGGASVSHANTANSATSATNATNATNASTAANANALGGQPPSAYEQASNILTAVVTNNGTTATVVRGSSGVTATRTGTGAVWVHMGRDVSNCTWIATQGNPASTFVPGDFATVRGNTSISGGSVNDVFVVTYSTTGSQVDANFHLLVIC
jgi:hypothetical protein